MVGDIHIWQLLAGLGLFLFGMHMLEEALKALAGRSFRIFLRKHTENRVKAVFAGALVTSILQSSTMVALLVMSLAGAGILGLKNGIGMIIGANLGTTFTGWLVSVLGFKLNIQVVIMPLLAIGGLGIIFLRSERLSNFSKLLMGFSFMFLGLGFMKDGFAEFADKIDMTFLEDKPLVLFVLFGFILAASIQSSSASMLIFLSSLAAGIITLHQAVYLIIGAQMGTTITALLATIRANEIKKKVGWSQFYYNIFNGLLALALVPLILKVIADYLRIVDPLFSLVAFHSLMNLSGIIVVLPFLGLFARLIDRIVPAPTEQQSRYIAQVDPTESHAAIEALRRETRRFLHQTLRINGFVFGHLPDGRSMNFAAAYDTLKEYESEISAFYLKVQQSTLDANEVNQLNAYTAAIRNAALSTKDLKDIRHNLTQIATATSEQLYALFGKIRSNQSKFYKELTGLIDREDIPAKREIKELDHLQEEFYHQESEAIYAYYSEGRRPEVPMPSLLNLIREISNSNDALLRSLRYLYGYKIEFSTGSEIIQ